MSKGKKACVLTKAEVKKLRKCQKAVLDVISDRDLIEKCLDTGHFRMKNPACVFVNHAKDGDFDYFSDDAYDELLMRVEACGDDGPVQDIDYAGMTAGLLNSGSELLYGLSVLLDAHAIQKRWLGCHREMNDALFGHLENTSDMDDTCLDELLEEAPILVTPVEDDAE